jgi:hypothetical protein
MEEAERCADILGKGGELADLETGLQAGRFCTGEQKVQRRV